MINLHYLVIVSLDSSTTGIRTNTVSKLMVVVDIKGL